MGNRKPEALQTFATGWTEHTGGGRAWLPRSRPLKHKCTNVTARTFSYGLLIVKSFLMLVKRACVAWACEQIVYSCPGSVFVFMDPHSVTSVRLFMHVGKIIHVVI